MEINFKNVELLVFKFNDNLENVLKKNKTELIIFNTVLQYVEDPWYFLKLIKKKGIMIIINNILFTKKTMI